MSKRIVTTLSFFVSVALIFFYLFSPSRSHSRPIERPKLEPFKDVISAPVLPQKKATAKKLESFKNKPCEGTFTALHSFSLDKLLGPDSTLVFSAVCKDYLMGQNYPDVIGSFLNQCLDEKDKIKSSEECKSLLIFVRAMAIAETFSDNEDLSQYDKNVLMNKLVWNVIKDKNLSGDMLDLNLRIADELIDQAPNFYAAYKAKFVMMLSKDAFYAANTPENEYLKVLDPMKRLQAKDDTLKDGELVRYLSREEYNNVLALSQELAASNPKDYRGPYFESIYYWKTGNRQNAIEALSRARELAPKNPVILETLEKAKTKPTGESIYSISFGFDFTSI